MKLGKICLEKVLEIQQWKEEEKRMKKKLVVALLSALSLTVVGTGTVFATDKTSAIEIEKEHVHGDECKWIVDKPAWTEEHPEEGHWEKVLVSPEEGHYEKVEVSPEEGHYEFHYICNGCGQDFGGGDAGYNAVHAHNKEQMLQGNTACGGYHDDQVWVVDKEAVYEDRWVVDKPAVYEDKYVVDKPAWTEEHPEEGHWECEETPENPDQKPEEPENPEQPENPDQKPEQPEQPENPDVETPETPDAENPETPGQPEAEAPNNQSEANNEEVKTPVTETKKEGTAPKTGDTTSALPVAGAGVASLGVALATILKKRK